MFDALIVASDFSVDGMSACAEQRGRLMHGGGARLRRRSAVRVAAIGNSGGDGLQLSRRPARCTRGQETHRSRPALQC